MSRYPVLTLKIIIDMGLSCSHASSVQLSAKGQKSGGLTGLSSHALALAVHISHSYCCQETRWEVSSDHPASNTANCLCERQEQQKHSAILPARALAQLAAEHSSCPQVHVGVSRNPSSSSQQLRINKTAWWAWSPLPFSHLGSQTDSIQTQTGNLQHVTSTQFTAGISKAETAATWMCLTARLSPDQSQEVFNQPAWSHTPSQVSSDDSGSVVPIDTRPWGVNVYSCKAASAHCCFQSLSR